MRTKVGGGNWTTKLANAITSSTSGDTIVGHTAARRMKGDIHGITFECGGRAVRYIDADDPPAGSGFDGDGYPVGA